MHRSWLPTLLLACAAPAIAWGAPPAASGVYLVDFHVRLGAAVPEGSLVTCRVRIMPGVPAPGRTQRPAALAVSGVALVQGGTAHCAVEIPAAWTGARTAATLSYEIDAATGGMVRTASGEGVRLSYPPAGGAARMELSLTL